jgi:hypothetical protein
MDILYIMAIVVIIFIAHNYYKISYSKGYFKGYEDGFVKCLDELKKRGF